VRLNLAKLLVVLVFLEGRQRRQIGRATDGELGAICGGTLHRRGHGAADVARARRSSGMRLNRGADPDESRARTPRATAAAACRGGHGH
jgi:hypothetical protein